MNMFNKYLENTLRFNMEQCNNCRKCIEVCPHAVYTLDDNKVRMARPENCMECGACRMNCPENAIEVESGVGCAAAMMWSAIKGRKEVSCDCGCG